MNTSIMNDIARYRLYNPCHFYCQKALFTLLFLLILSSCTLEKEQVSKGTISLNITGFSIKSEGFGNLKSMQIDTDSGFIHKYSPAILSFIASDGTEFTFNTGSTSISDFKFTLPVGNYNFFGVAKTGESLSEDIMSYEIPSQDIIIEESTTEINISVTPTCILLLLVDESDLLDKAFIENESKPLYLDGIYRYAYLNSQIKNFAYIVKKDGTTLEILLGKFSTGQLYEIIVTADGITETLIPDPDGFFNGFYTEYRGQPGSGSIIDARNGVWTFENGWVATPKASTDVYWVGGEFFLTIDDHIYSPTDAWEEIWHHNGGFTLKYNNVNWVFDRVNVRHVGDGFNISAGTKFFTIKNSYVADIRDDAVQNDDMYSGLITNNFFDGVYVGFSCREDNNPRDGGAETLTIDNNLVWIKPMYSVFKGDSPGNGQLIKWQTNKPSIAPHLVFKNNIIRMEELPFQTGSVPTESFYFPPDGEFDNNVLVWEGALPVPVSLKYWFNPIHNSRIGTMEDWDNAVQTWYEEHPYFDQN